MFSKPIFETLPIAIIAVGILSILLVHSMMALFAGILLIVVTCIILYLRLNQLGTDPDMLEYKDNPKHSH